MQLPAEQLRRVRFSHLAQSKLKVKSDKLSKFKSQKVKFKIVELKQGTIKHLQEYIAFKIKERNFEDETLHERLLLLTEELGELVNACRKISGMNVDKNRKITNQTGEELVDVINMVFAVGIELDVDIEKEFIEKNKEIDKRIYRRGKNHFKFNEKPKKIKKRK